MKTAYQPDLLIRIFNIHTGDVQMRDEHWLRRMRRPQLKQVHATFKRVLTRLRAGEVLETEHEWWKAVLL